MQRSTVLICDDNVAVHESLAPHLRDAGYIVLSLYDGAHLKDILRIRKINLVVLDVMLPTASGTDVCREIRQTSDVPILMLSARSEEDDRILGLELGADDYVTKPFSPREVVTRINVILKRTNPRKESTDLFFSNVTVHAASLSATVAGQPFELTPKEFAVLQLLLKHPNKVHRRNFILDEVWGSDYVGDTRAVDTIVKRLRNKLAKAGAGCTIQSVYGVGYRIEECLMCGKHSCETVS